MHTQLTRGCASLLAGFSSSSFLFRCLSACEMNADPSPNLSLSARLPASHGVSESVAGAHAAIAVCFLLHLFYFISVLAFFRVLRSFQSRQRRVSFVKSCHTSGSISLCICGAFAGGFSQTTLASRQQAEFRQAAVQAKAAASATCAATCCADAPSSGLQICNPNSGALQCGARLDRSRALMCLPF